MDTPELLLTINYEAEIHGLTAVWHTRFSVSGATAADVLAKADAQCAAMGGKNLIAAGLKNSRHDWEAVFGPSDMPDAAFGMP